MACDFFARISFYCILYNLANSSFEHIENRVAYKIVCPEYQQRTRFTFIKKTITHFCLQQTKLLIDTAYVVYFIIQKSKINNYH